MAMQDERAEAPTQVIPRPLQRELWKHPGKWVAIAENRLVAVAGSPGEARAAASLEGHDEPLVLQVLDDPRPLII